MVLPLSQDLQARIVGAVSEGSSIRQAAARFDVSPSSAIKLMQRVRATGSTSPVKIGGYRRPLLDGSTFVVGLRADGLIAPFVIGGAMDGLANIEIMWLSYPPPSWAGAG